MSSGGNNRMSEKRSFLRIHIQYVWGFALETEILNRNKSKTKFLWAGHPGVYYVNNHSKIYFNKLSLPQKCKYSLG